jgi:hypothetical protein
VRLSPEQGAIMERLNYITTELDTWAQVHHLISETQEAHTNLLQQVLDAVQPQSVEDDGGGVLGDLFRRLIAMMQEHQQTLDRIERRLSEPHVK